MINDQNKNHPGSAPPAFIEFVDCSTRFADHSTCQLVLPTISDYVNALYYRSLQRKKVQVKQSTDEQYYLIRLLVAFSGE